VHVRGQHERAILAHGRRAVDVIMVTDDIIAVGPNCPRLVASKIELSTIEASEICLIAYLL
jgi:hydrogenase maturation factor